MTVTLIAYNKYTLTLGGPLKAFHISAITVRHQMATYLIWNDMKEITLITIPQDSQNAKGLKPKSNDQHTLCYQAKMGFTIVTLITESQLDNRCCSPTYLLKMTHKHRRIPALYKGWNLCQKTPPCHLSSANQAGDTAQLNMLPHMRRRFAHAQ